MNGSIEFICMMYLNSPLSITTTRYPMHFSNSFPIRRLPPCATPSLLMRHWLEVRKNIKKAILRHKNFYKGGSTSETIVSKWCPVHNLILISTVNVILIWDIGLWVVYIPGPLNHITDALLHYQNLVPGIQIESFPPPQDVIGAEKNDIVNCNV